MKRLYRLVFAWLLMLALPLQGYAGTHMLMCAADIGARAHAAAQPAPRVPPCHAHASAHKPTPAHDAGGHDAAKPGSCAACSLLAPMAPGALLPLGLDGPVSAAIPFDARRLPSVDPSLPDRPPRFAAA